MTADTPKNVCFYYISKDIINFIVDLFYLFDIIKIVKKYKKIYRGKSQ